MAPTWNPDDYSSNPIAKKFVSSLIELANEYSDFVYLKKNSVRQPGLMIKDRNSGLALMEYRPEENKMFARPERYEKLSERMPVPRTLIDNFHSDIKYCQGYITNPKVFIDHLRKIFDALYSVNTPADKAEPETTKPTDSDHQNHGFYLPKREDYDNARRRLLREGKKNVTISNILDIMKNDLETAGYKLLQSWRSVTEKNIEIWRQREE